jgi:DNA (cytosine-5)-methyltransferase 1
VNVLDLFSGIGGFSLGLERAGMRTVAFCEIDPYCRAVLRKHWPDVDCFPDIRKLWFLKNDSGGFTAECHRSISESWSYFDSIDVICGGFPCQDISVAGKGAGIEGSRSGLWSEYARIIGEVRPRYVIVENVAALLGRGLERVLGDLAALGYDAEWHCIPACAVGAPHERDRVWIIAYSHGLDWRRGESQGGAVKPNGSETQDGFGTTSDAAPLLRSTFFREQSDRALRSYWSENWEQKLEALRGMDDGVRGRLDGLSALGNAVVPQIPEIIGRAIMKHNAN